MGIICNYDLLVLAATATILAYFYVKSKLRYFSDRGIPHLKPTLAGQWRSMRTFTNLLDNMKLLYNGAKDEPYSGYYQLLKPSFVIRDPALIQQILIKDFSYFHDHGFEIDEKNSPLEGHLFNMTGDKWRLLRYKLAPTFTSGKLKWMLPLMEDSAEKTLKNVGPEEMSMKEIFREYSISSIATCAFGIDGESISDPNSEFRKVLDRLFKPSALTTFRFSLRFLWPWLSLKLKMAIFPKDITDFFISLTKESFELRKKTGLKRNDFIQLLLELKEKGSIDIDFKDLEEDEKHILDGTYIPKLDHPTEKLDLTDELLSAQIFVFWVAGSENSAVILAMVSYLLSKNKDVQDRVRKEVKEMTEKHGGYNYLALRDMKLLDACISEANRIHPPAIALFRKCNKTYTLMDGKQIEKGQSVFIPVISLQNDPKYWDEPDEFNPDRFLDNEIVPGTFLPFGDGPRICIAQRFALLQTKIMLAKLIDSFEIIHSNKTKEPLKFESLNSNSVVGGLWASFKRINKS